MPTLLVVERAEDWPPDLPGVEVVPARRYLTDASLSLRRGVKVFNLCRSYRYQSVGYYVSLLAAARGHRPLPSVATIQDLKSRSYVRFVSEELEATMQRSLAPIASPSFTLSVYFGSNLAARHRRLALQLFNLFPAPLLRAELERAGERWQLRRLRPIGWKDVPEEHRGFVVERAGAYFAGRRAAASPRPQPRWEIAILWDPKAQDAPSNPRALQRFVRAAQALEMRAELIVRDDLGRLAEFDALFLRETTAVEHHTYRWARRAAADGLAVIDDPDSILRCTNKVFLAELLGRHRIPAPRTVVLHRDNLSSAIAEIGLPCILKLPDSSFSQGVVRADDAESFRERARRFFEETDLLIAQEFLPTGFDWRIGVLDRQPLFACRYHMARGHWQIVRRDGRGQSRYGDVEAVPLADAPPAVVATALGAANLIGDGLYGVDLKEVAGEPRVIEVNDNPNVDAGYEDAVLGDELYLAVMRSLLLRIERLRGGRSERGGGSG